MNFKEDYQIKEFEKLNINEKRFIQDKRQKKNSILILIIIILFIIIFICCMFFFSKLEKRINHIIKFKYIEKDINKEIIKKLDFVINKLKFIKQESESNKKLDNYNNNNIYYMLSIKEVLGYNKIRIGNNNDGGYILLNDLKNIKIGYSFGISREISFDKGLADKNIDVFMYDHTINKLPFENPKFHWKKIGLTGRNNNDNMKTLPDLIEENGHSNEKNMILKIDIESNEWDVFQYLPTKNLRQFKYIVAELHFSNSSKVNYYSILKKLQETHQIFHIHCNNCGRIIKLNRFIICNLLEISFIQKEGYKFIEDNNIYPIKDLDYKNCKSKEEISYLINLFNK
jgi:hypothetical protein